MVGFLIVFVFYIMLFHSLDLLNRNCKYIDWVGVYCPVSTLAAIWDAHVKRKYMEGQVKIKYHAQSGE